MSIATRINSMENNIRNAYHGLDSIGIDTSNTNKNIENISALLEDFYDSLPKVSGTGSSIQLTPTKKGRITSQINGDTLQDGTPTPDTPIAIQSVTGTQNITVCGKNLFNKDNVIENKFLDVDGVLNDNNAWVISNYIRVNPNETIYYKGLTQVGTAPYSAYYDINKNFISSFKQQTGSNNSITIPSNAYYVRFSINHSASYHNENTFQVERNSNTAYEAYNGNDYTIHLGNIELNKLGNYKDYITGTPDNWSIVKNIGKYVLDSTKNWYIADTNNYQVTLGGNDRIYLKQSATGYSNYFRVSNSGSDIFMYPILQGSTDYIRISNAINKWETVDDFKTWLSSNNVELVYPLATPTTTPITDTTLINDLNNFYYAMSKNGETNISVDGNLPMILDVSALKDTE